MGAVIQYQSDEPDRANLLPPEGRDFGAEKSLEVERYLKKLTSNARTTYLDEVMAAGGKYNRYDYEFDLEFRAEVPVQMYPPRLVVQCGETIHDFYSNFGFWFVSDAFKTLIEEFDGDIHQFTNVELVDSKRVSYSKSDFFYFKCRQVLNTVDETSEAIYFSEPIEETQGEPTAFSFTVGNSFRMFKSEIGSAGIWQELRCLRSFFASEDFLQEAANRGLTGIRRFTDFEEI